jgi:hypothetical protein
MEEDLTLKNMRRDPRMVLVKLHRSGLFKTFTVMETRKDLTAWRGMESKKAQKTLEKYGISRM